MCFGFDQLSKAFSNYLFPVNSVTIKLKLESVRSEMTPVLMHFAENAQLICVDGRPERIEMHAFSNETKTALVLNGAVSQSSSGYMVFRPKRLAKFLSTERQPLKLAVSSIERAGTSKLVVASPRRRCISFISCLLLSFPLIISRLRWLGKLAFSRKRYSSNNKLGGIS